ncbi:MAG: 50S ribosomal protein L24 [Candidatus Taylorbacteria bacterium]|nr:50S ribosomal protein L24 [Candidatus Taylorbacteria bacterium]
MKIKKGDNVRILTGKDRGKTGKVVKAIPKAEKVIVEGLNLVRKHVRARRRNQKGQITEVAMPIHVSNVSLIDERAGKPTRKRI